jgi:DNA-binding MarR family transcriptional regulator
MSPEPIQPVSFGHSVALAQQALTGALAGALSDAGSSADEWFALNTIAVRGAVTPADTIRDELRRAPGAAAASVDGTLARLTAGGLVAVASHGDVEVLTLTPDGNARHAALSDEARALTAAMLDGLDPDAVATTTTVLRTVTDRANASRAAAA